MIDLSPAELFTITQDPEAAIAKAHAFLADARAERLVDEKCTIYRSAATSRQVWQAGASYFFVEGGEGILFTSIKEAIAKADAMPPDNWW